MNVLITLSSAGASTGPTFNLYSDVDTYATPFETGVAKSALVAGYTSTVVPNAATMIRVQSVGACTNYGLFAIAGVTTTTTTTSGGGTTTTTTSSTSTTTTTASPTTTTTTTRLRYTYRIAEVLSDVTCELDVYQTNWWSYTSYGDGYYTLNGGGTKYFVQSISHTTYTNQITSVVASSCTPAPTYDYYLADEYNCPDCTVNASSVLVKATGATLIPNRFYPSFDVSNFIYKITDTGQAPGVAIQVNTAGYSSCAAAGCGTATTTTTTSFMPEMYPVTLSYDANSDVNACSNPTGSYFMDTTSFTTATQIYTDIYGQYLAAEGYYSNGIRVRYLITTLGSSAPC